MLEIILSTVYILAQIILQEPVEVKNYPIIEVNKLKGKINVTELANVP